MLGYAFSDSLHTDLVETALRRAVTFRDPNKGTTHGVIFHADSEMTVMTLDADTDFKGLKELDLATHPAQNAAPFRRTVVACHRLAAAEQELPDAVEAARRPVNPGR